MNLPVFDLHCDTALELLDSQCRPVERLKRRRGHIDLERGGKLPAYAQLFAFFTTPDMDATGRFSPEMIFDASCRRTGIKSFRPGLRRRSARRWTEEKLPQCFPWRALQALALTRAGWRSWRLWDSV